MTLAQELVMEGKYQNTIDVIINGHKAGVSTEVLALLTNLPESEVKKIIQKYQK